MRLDRYLHDLGFGSRREIARLLKRQEVTVDGLRVRDGAQTVTAESAVALDGEPLVYAPVAWLMLNKPAGVLTATKDAHAETVLDLIDARYQRMGVVPVGRLDKDTTGLLLLTNDGAQAHRLTSPKHHVAKVYDVRYDGVLAPDAVRRSAEGINLGDFVTAPASLELLEDGHCLLTLHEGKFHQVKRMIHALGGVVTALARIRFGPLALDPALAPGQWRRLTSDEIAQLSTSPKKGEAS